MSNFNYVNGELVEVEPVEITEDGVVPGIMGPYRVVGATVRLTGVHNGSVSLVSGASLTLVGSLNGSLQVNEGCNATIASSHNGSVNIEARATVTVTGQQNGSVHVKRGGTFRVEPGGRHGGSIQNLGRYELAGERGGTLSGDGEYVEEPGSRVRRPTRFIEDSPVYEW